MGFAWKDYLDLAGYLQTQPTGACCEAALRSAVSRAYYAAFCHGRNYALAKLQYQPSYSSQDHVQLRQHFTSCGMGLVARRLDALRQWRNQCDYQDSLTANLANMVAQAIRKAEEVINNL